MKVTETINTKALVIAHLAAAQEGTLYSPSLEL